MYWSLRYFAVLLLWIACFAGAPPRPGTPSPVALFESHYRQARTLQVTFLERLLEDGRVARVEAGTAYFRRPGRMRWEYESPEKNLFLVDGKTAWFYVPKDHTVTRVPAKESTDWRTPLALLAGETKVSRVCAQVGLAADTKPESPENAVFDCRIRGQRGTSAGKPSSATPEGQDPSESVVFEVAKSSGELVRVLIRDPGRVTIEFHFKDWLTDPKLADSLFRFQVPQGVAIVNDGLPGDESNMTH